MRIGSGRNRQRARASHRGCGQVGSFLLTLAVIWLLAKPTTATTPSAPSVRVPVEPLDLAAMTLVPSDLVGPEWEGEPVFALAGGGRIGLREDATRVARDRGETRVAASVAMQDAFLVAGWQGRYESRLAVPFAADSDRYAAIVLSAVTEYASDDGAAAVFALLGTEGAAASGRETGKAVELGEESRIVRTFVPGIAAETPARRSELTFRRGNVLGSVALSDLTNERAWGVAAVEGLAAALLARIGRVLVEPEPRLEPRLLRLDPRLAPDVDRDVYDRRGGQTFSLYGVDPEDGADRLRLYGPATDVYSYETYVSSGTNADGTPYYAVKLYRFPDPDAASAWLRSAPEQLFADPGSFLELALVEEAGIVGDESRTMSYAFPVSDPVTTRGFRVYARVANEVARVQLDAEREVSLAQVEAIARVQVACLAMPVCADAAPIPSDLLPSGSSAAAPRA